MALSAWGAFVGMAQCLPGMLALLYWPGANRKGMVIGLIAGVGVWLWGLWLPLMFSLPVPTLPITPLTDTGAPVWYNVTLLSLAVNILLLIVISLFTRISEGEQSAAEACSVDAVIRTLSSGSRHGQRLFYPLSPRTRR